MIFTLQEVRPYVAHPNFPVDSQRQNFSKCSPAAPLEYATAFEATACQQIHRRSVGGRQCFRNVFSALCDPESLHCAAKSLRRKRSRNTPGIDGLRFTDYETKLGKAHTTRKLAESLLVKLISGTYRPQPVRRILIAKPNGGKRPIGIPTIEDRIIHKAAADLISAIYDPGMAEHSFGFRPRRNIKMALNHIREIASRDDAKLFAKWDVTKFFDEISRRRLIAGLRKRIRDDRFIHVISQIINCGFRFDNRLHFPPIGLPQGSPLSPVLANVYLTNADYWVRDNPDILGYGRYADDILIITYNQERAISLGREFRQMLWATRRLRTSPEKEQVADPNSGMNWLGFDLLRSQHDQLRATLDIEAGKPIHRLRERLNRHVVDINRNPSRKAISGFLCSLNGFTRYAQSADNREEAVEAAYRIAMNALGTIESQMLQVEIRGNIDLELVKSTFIKQRQRSC